MARNIIYFSPVFTPKSLGVVYEFSTKVKKGNTKRGRKHFEGSNEERRKRRMFSYFTKDILILSQISA
jgi:hypothetical protein